MESKRPRKVGNEIKKIIAEEINENISPKYKNAVISVLDVSVAPDLRNAKIFVSVFMLDGSSGIEAYNEVLKNGTFLRNQLAHKLSLRIVPYLTFVKDEGISAEDLILKKLKEIQKKG